MLRRAYLIVAAGLISAGLAQAETPALETIKAAMDESWKKVESFTSDVLMEFVMPFGEQPLDLTGSGQLNYLRDGGKDKYRQQMTARLPEPFSMEMKLDVLFDGDTVYTTTEIMGQQQKQQGAPSLEQGALPPGGSRLLASMEEQMTLAVLPEAKVDGHDVFVIEGKPKNAELPFSKAIFYIDKALGIQRKSEIFQPDGTVGITVSFNNVKLNSNPSPSLFVPEK